MSAVVRWDVRYSYRARQLLRSVRCRDNSQWFVRCNTVSLFGVIMLRKCQSVCLSVTFVLVCRSVVAVSVLSQVCLFPNFCHSSVSLFSSVNNVRWLSVTNTDVSFFHVSMSVNSEYSISASISSSGSHFSRVSLFVFKQYVSLKWTSLSLSCQFVCQFQLFKLCLSLY